MSNKDYIEVDFFVCGVYKGKRKVARSSITGRLLSGDYLGAAKKTIEMKAEIDEVIEVEASDDCSS